MEQEIVHQQVHHKEIQEEQVQLEDMQLEEVEEGVRAFLFRELSWPESPLPPPHRCLTSTKPNPTSLTLHYVSVEARLSCLACSSRTTRMKATTMMMMTRVRA
jgi:hypothetical protein